MKSKIKVKITRLEVLNDALGCVEDMQDNCKVWDAEKEEYVLPYDTENNYHRSQLRRIEGLKWLYDELAKLADKA